MTRKKQVVLATIAVMITAIVFLSLLGRHVVGVRAFGAQAALLNSRSFLPVVIGQKQGPPQPQPTITPSPEPTREPDISGDVRITELFGGF